MLKSKQSVKGCVMRKKEKVIILFLIIFLIVIFVFLIIAKNNRSKMIENNNHREDVVPEKKENDTDKSLESNEIEKKDLKEKVENKKTDKKSNQEKNSEKKDNNGTSNKEEKIKLEGIELDFKKITLIVDERKKLTPKFQPDNANNKEVEWTSSDEKIARVINGEIIANSPGNAIISVKSKDGNYVSTCEVKVEYEPLSVKTDIHLEKHCKSNGSGTFCYGGIKATIKPSGGDKKYTKYYIKLYENGVGGVESKTSTVWNNSYSFGEYYVLYEVEDSSGNHIKEFSKIFKITKDSPVEIIME